MNADLAAIVTAAEKATLDELVAKKLILGNQLTEVGWRKLRKARPGALEGLIPFTPSQHRGK